jgi:hypothetical protein
VGFELIAQALLWSHFGHEEEMAVSDQAIEDVNVPWPNVEPQLLKFSFGPSKINIAPGGTDVWVEGTYQDLTGFLPLRIDETGGNVHISQRLKRGSNLKGTPLFDLKLGKAMPYGITIDAGANDHSHLDFGGLSLTNIEIHHGAGKISLDFSEPTAQPMEKLHVSCGATDTRLSNLANANAKQIAVDTGAAQVSLDFSGRLSHDTNVKINSGMASITVSVPSTTPARISTQGFLGGIEPGDGFVTKGGAFLNEAAVDGGTPMLSIEASVNLSQFKLIST